MFNVLTKDLKRNIIKNYKINRLIMFFVFINCLIAFLIITLIPSYIFIDIQAGNLKMTNDNVVSSIGLKQHDKIKEEFKKNNHYLNFLVTNSNNFNVSKLVSDIIEEKNSNIVFKELFFTKQTATSSTISIKGVSKDRKSLVSFVDNLSSEFGEIDLPVSNFTSEKDLLFSFDFIINI